MGRASFHRTLAAASLCHMEEGGGGEGDDASQASGLPSCQRAQKPVSQPKILREASRMQRTGLARGGKNND